MDKQFLGLTQNGIKVYVEPFSSYVSSRFADTPNLLSLVKEALLKIPAAGNIVYVQVDLDRTLGPSLISETGSESSIVYAKELYKDNYTRFVRNAESIDSSYLTIIIRKVEDDYILYDAWIGPVVPLLPGDILETKESKPFWRTHAVVLRSQRLQPGSEIAIWPWD